MKRQNSGFSLLKFTIVLLALSFLSLGTMALIRIKADKDADADALSRRDEIVKRLYDLERAPLMFQANANLTPGVTIGYNPEFKGCLQGRCLPSEAGKPQPFALANIYGNLILSASAITPGTGTAISSFEVSSAPLEKWLYLTASGIPCGVPLALGNYPKCPLMLQTYFTYDCDGGDCSNPEKVQLHIQFYIRYNKEVYAVPPGTWSMPPVPPVSTYTSSVDNTPANARPVNMNAAAALRGYFTKNN